MNGRIITIYPHLTKLSEKKLFAFFDSQFTMTLCTNDDM